MDIKSGLQTVADKLRVEAVTLVHAAEQRAHLSALKSCIGRAAAWGSDRAQRLSDDLASVDTQVRTDYTDFHE
jgi:hypothetical protein